MVHNQSFIAHVSVHWCVIHEIYTIPYILHIIRHEHFVYSMCLYDTLQIYEKQYSFQWQRHILQWVTGLESIKVILAILPYAIFT